jgi:flagellar biosynthesis protein FlhG
MGANATIIPIAAGKGGVGKSFLTANLAIALAQQGHQTIAVDMDLGGSNLHSFLGLPNRHPGIGDYLQAKSGSLESMLVPSGIDNLSFLPGDGKTPFMANIPFAQKMKLIAHIRKLPAAYILLDLGAGSTFNTLDFFSISRKGIVITTPEPPAIMNMLVFLKNFLLRSISRSLSQDHALRNFLRELHKRPMEDQMASIKSLRDEIAIEDPEAAQTITDVCGNYCPRIVFNLGEHPDELRVTGQISKSLETVLSLTVEYFGFIFYDPAVRQSVREQKALLPNWPECVAAENIYRIARRVDKYWGAAVRDSANLLKETVKEFYTGPQ